MKTVRLFKKGQSQGVKLPKECHFSEGRVQIGKVENNLILMPMEKPWWQSLVDSLAMFPSDLMVDREQPKEQ